MTFLSFTQDSIVSPLWILTCFFGDDANGDTDGVGSEVPVDVKVLIGVTWHEYVFHNSGSGILQWASLTESSGFGMVLFLLKTLIPAIIILPVGQK